MTRVKICGITNLRDAMLAVDAGADAIGFVFASGPRHVTPAQARKISKALPAFVHRVGVFVETAWDHINLIGRAAGLSWAQLHGDQDAAFAARLALPSIRVFRVASGRVVAQIKKSRESIVHLDTLVRGVAGGSGKTFDWKIAAEAGKTARVILAGGLTAENVAKAIRIARPFAVDVSSGVESRPGKKDAKQVRKFLSEAHR